MEITMSHIRSFKPIFDYELFRISPQDREDVKQNAIVRIIEAAAKKTEDELPESKLFSFAHTVVKHTVADYFRSLYRKTEIMSTLVHWCDGLDSESVSGGADNFSVPVEDYGYDMADLRVDYEMNIDKFYPMERKVIEYLLFNEEGKGMNMSEISSAVGVHKSHMTRGMKKLREVCADR